MLRYEEREVWRMTPYKIKTLFGYHKEYNPQQFKQEKTAEYVDDIDAALGGL